MHVLSPLLCDVDRLAYLLQRGDVSRVIDRVSMILPRVAVVLAHKRPDTPEDRAAWDRYAEPLIRAVRTCERIATTMPWPVCRSGLTFVPGWIASLMASLATYFALPGLDDLFGTPPSLATFEPSVPIVPSPSVN